MVTFSDLALGSTYKFLQCVGGRYMGSNPKVRGLSVRSDSGEERARENSQA